MADDLSLAAEFPTPDLDEWRGLVDKVLKGRDFDKVLVDRLADGFDVQPLYTGIDGAAERGMPGIAPFVRGASAVRPELGWDIRQPVNAPGVARANDEALRDLERGVTSLWVDLDQVGSDDLASLLDGVLLDLAPVALRPSAAGADRARMLLALLPDGARASLGLDPLGVWARTGHQTSLQDMATLAAESLRDHPAVLPISVDVTPYVDAGATPAQEIAISLATGVAYLRELDAVGVELTAAAGGIEFVYAATADQFVTMAKLRAARLCWSRVLGAAGVHDVAQRQHVIAAESMLTTVDPWVNMLRSTVACFAAAVGGAEAVTVHAFDAATGVPDELGRRVARNTQLLLLEESHLADVRDPAGGSWHVEQLTDDIAQSAWGRFQSIEATGAMAGYLGSGAVAADLESAWNDRVRRLSTRKEQLTGVSEFPNLDEEPLDRPARAPETSGGLPRRAPASVFEDLRNAAASADPRPTIFLANLGPISVHTARATYAQNYFEVGGVEALTNDGFDTAAAAAAGFDASGARVAVICSSDAVYASDAAATAEALKAAGAIAVYLAGHPGADRESYEDAGIDGFIHLGSDLVAVLRTVHDQLGVSA